MKKITFIFIIAMLAFAWQANAQICDPTPTPDMGCEDILDPGQICPMELPPATQGVAYEQIITIIPPDEDIETGVAIYQIRVDEVNGLPEGIVWCKSEDIFLVTDPYTRYTVLISGTTTADIGEYPLELVITPWIDVFGSPIQQDPVTDNTFSLTVLPPAPVAAFLADFTTAETAQVVTFTDESTNEPNAWAWTFEGGTPETSDIASPTVTWDTEGQYDVTLIATNDGGSDEITIADYITIDNEVMVNQSLLESIKVYPNPATSQITVEANGVKSLVIIDMLGKIVYSNENPNTKEVIDISNLTKANYFIKINTIDGEITKSISIK